jgi:3-isopropylmalate dehydrogenase
MENSDRHYRIVGLPGDCIGPEVYQSARRVLQTLAGAQGFSYELNECLIGGAAVDATGVPLPQETIDACKDADAALLGAVGGPKWDGNPAEQRPELGLLQIRSALNLFCNLRPVVLHPSLQHFSPLKPDRLVNVDMMIVRELTSGSYFGKKWRTDNEAEDVCRYTRGEIERVTIAAGRIAQQRDGRITLVDKANVLETSRLWRAVVREVMDRDFPELDLEFLYVDAAAMHLLTRPGDFDVMLTENMFGDILSDEASMLCGSLGLLPSASINEERFGMYEPIHGSAPDIAGQGIANPYAMLLSTAMMLRHSLDDEEAADALETCVYGCWEDGILSKDLDPDGPDTEEITDAVCERLVR